MNSFVWGSDMWNLLHATSLQSPTRGSADDETKFKRVLNGFRHACPCSLCKTSFQHLLEMEKFNLRDRINPAVFAWELHNAVNTKLGRPEVTYENVFRRYNYAVDPLTESQLWQLIYITTAHAATHGHPEVGREFAEAALDLAGTLPALKDTPFMTGLRSTVAEQDPVALSDRILKLGEERFGKQCTTSGAWCSVTQDVNLHAMRGHSLSKTVG